MGIFDALPLISFAFGCHMQMIPIFGELKDDPDFGRRLSLLFRTWHEIVLNSHMILHYYLSHDFACESYLYIYFLLLMALFLGAGF
jgi:hypothetical protein